MAREPTRRSVLAVCAASAAGLPRPAGATGAGQFAADDFATVGVFGLDWLLDPVFMRLLDQIAASPGAVCLR